MFNEYSEEEWKAYFSEVEQALDTGSAERLFEIGALVVMPKWENGMRLVDKREADKPSFMINFHLDGCYRDLMGRLLRFAEILTQEDLLKYDIKFGSFPSDSRFRYLKLKMHINTALNKGVCF